MIYINLLLNVCIVVRSHKIRNGERDRTFEWANSLCNQLGNHGLLTGPLLQSYK